MTNLKTSKLIQLIKDNPDLPVVAMVNYDVVGENDGYWLGCFRDCSVGKYARYREKFYIDSEDDLKDAYFYQHDEDYQGMPSDLIEADLEEKTKDMWTEAILVYIEP